MGIHFQTTDHVVAVEKVVEQHIATKYSKCNSFANLISKLNFYKLIPYPMDNCFTGRRDRSRQTPEKDVLYILPAGPVTECAFARWRIVLHFLFTY